MRYFLFFSFIAVTLCCCTNKQGSVENTLIFQNENNAGISDVICEENLENDIIKRRLEIESEINKIQPVKKDLEDISSQGGEVFFYIKNKDTIFIRTIFYGEYGKLVQEFYNNDNIPFLLKEEVYSYEQSIYDNSNATIYQIDTNLILLSNFTIEKWCASGKLIQKSEYKDKIQNIRDAYRIIRE